jgi:RNA polymerase sigma-70 factor (ECF subfamily)
MTRTMRSPRLLPGDPAGTGPALPVPPHAPVTRPGPSTGAPDPVGLGRLGTGPTGPGPGPLPATPPQPPSAGAAPVHGGPPTRTGGPLSGPAAAADAAAGEPVRRRLPGAVAEPATVAPPRQRVPGTPGGELRVVPGGAAPTATPTAPGPRAAPADPHDGGESSGPWVLVHSAQAGDMNAFSELFDRYYDVVFRYVLFRMNDRTLAEDITQETFLRALRRIGSVTYQGRDIGAWFVTIARNLIFDHVKSSRYRLESTTSDIIELSPSTHGPEQQVLDLATNEELLRCVRKLNADQQECISLRFLQGLSVAETAKVMDRNEGAVKALQHRAVRRLAQLLPEGLR